MLAGRPLINAVGKPRCGHQRHRPRLLAESFMAGDALNGGGFVVLNGPGLPMTMTEPSESWNLLIPAHIFSLASGGAIYVRDPHRKLVEEQLNGGQFAKMIEADWKLIEPYLMENEKLFGITIDRLLTVDGEKKAPKDVYRKIRPKKTGAQVDDDGLAETTD